MNEIVKNVVMYAKEVKAVSMASCNEVTIIGQQEMVLEDGRTIEQYIYNINGYTPKNGKPFIALKSNLMII